MPAAHRARDNDRKGGHKRVAFIIFAVPASLWLMRVINMMTIGGALRSYHHHNPVVIKADIDTPPGCDFYMAESSLPGAGLGVFTAVPLSKGDFAQPSHDLCLYYFEHQPQIYNNPNGMWTWQDYHFGGQNLRRSYEEGHAWGATAGIVTLNNNMNEASFATHVQYADPAFIFTNGGLERQRDPGAGAITHFFGATTKTLRDVEPGSELLLHR